MLSGADEKADCVMTSLFNEFLCGDLSQSGARNNLESRVHFPAFRWATFIFELRKGFVSKVKLASEVTGKVEGWIVRLLFRAGLLTL